MRYNILILTDLPVWSLDPEAGAKSFSETLKYYEREHNLTLASSQKKVTSYNYKYLRHYNVHRLTRSRFLKLFLKPILWILNIIISYRFVVSNIDDFDVIYCYEIAHVIPAKLAIVFNKKKQILVTRFQGTILTSLVSNMNPIKMCLYSLRHFDHILALKTRSDILIMTDDGTQGDRVLRRLNNRSNILFLKNGVEIYNKKQKQFDAFNLSFVSCSRLVPWKRVDRVINVYSVIKEKFPEAKLSIIGTGPCHQDLVSLCYDLDIADSVVFHGALKHEDTIDLMSTHSVLLSCFTLSNVGNPLWEAQALGLWVGSLDNGDTSKYVIDGENGTIVDESKYLELGEKLCQHLLNKQKLSSQKLKHDDYVSWGNRLSMEAIHIKKQILLRDNSC